MQTRQLTDVERAELKRLEAQTLAGQWTALGRACREFGRLWLHELKHIAIKIKKVL